MNQETADAHRRTRLANERTYLAWWRGGLTALAVGVGAGAVAPELTSGRRWPFVVLGIGFSALAVAFISFGVHRQRRVEQAIDEGGFAPLGTGVALAFGIIGVVLALLVIVVVAIVA